ncbi:MAG: heme exporter protein A [Cycloclasticus sp.]|jgi:heme exporter protein A|tara:strand:- start:4692 stop:5306 length:615 start_codon:yes stop_codon:yes gene_type:complete
MTLCVENLNCWRGKQALFEKLSFTLEPKKLLLVEGSNGCGKTTLLKIIAGLRQPNGGGVRWKQKQLNEVFDDYKTQLKWLGHNNALNRNLSVRENLSVVLKLSSSRDADIETAIQKFGLSSQQHTLVKQLSAGMKRRLAIARLIIGRSSVWILDEPQTSLDKAGIKLFESMTTDFLDQGGMVVMASHQPLSIQNEYIQRLSLSR